jgi:transcriptional regulator GlxA family with amidase domain
VAERDAREARSHERALPVSLVPRARRDELPDYRNRLRVALAHELLAQTRLDIERVAERAGLASARQLRRAWRRWYPTPPRATRDAAAV